MFIILANNWLLEPSIKFLSASNSFISSENLQLAPSGQFQLEYLRKIPSVVFFSPSRAMSSARIFTPLLFQTAFPEYDPERVYVSDIKKTLAWYNLLLDKGMIEFGEESAEETNTEGNAEEEKKEKETEKHEKQS